MVGHRAGVAAHEAARRHLCTPNFTAFPAAKASRVPAARPWYRRRDGERVHVAAVSRLRRGAHRFREDAEGRGR